MYTFTILGSGTSYGVPMIGCHCPVCSSTDPRDRRTRAAGWLHGPGTSILFDFGADLREQAIRENISQLDAAFLTHIHADHLNGIDDLRAFSKLMRRNLTVYATAHDLEYIRHSFPYMFRSDILEARGWDVPHFQLKELDREPIAVGDVWIQPVPIIHGTKEIRGYKMGDFAYLTDCSKLPEIALRLVAGVRNMVIDGLRWQAHDTHFNFDQAIEATRSLHLDNLYLTHLGHDVMHALDEQRLPPGVHLAYDGLDIPVIC